MSPSSLSPSLRRPHVLAAVIVAFSPVGAQAATGRPANNEVSLTIEGAATSRTDFEARGAAAGGISVAQAGLKLSVPFKPLNAQWFPSVGLEYRHYTLDRSSGTPLPETLKSLGASFTLVGSLGPEWRLIGSVSPRLSNAGSGFSNRGLGFGVIAIANRNFNPEFSGGFGFVYDSLARGTGRILPVATFEWKPAPAWRMFLGFPRTGATWQIRNELTAEFVAEADFGSFYVTDDPLPRGVGNPALDRTRLEYQAFRVGPALTWKVTPAFQTRIAAGAVPLLNADYHRRHYKLKSDDTTAFASLELVLKF